MRSEIIRLLRRFYINFSAISTGAILALLTVLLLARFFLLSPERHIRMFSEHNIYTIAETTMHHSLSSIMEDLKKNAPESYAESKDIFDYIQKSMSSALIHDNLNNLLTGMFQYFSGDNDFLPDIRITDSVNADTVSDKFSLRILSKVDRVNIGAVLAYADRQDITDYLRIVRFAFYVCQSSFYYLLPLLLLFIPGLLVALSHVRDLFRWLSRTLITTALFILCWAALLAGLIFVLAPGISKSAALALSIPADTVSVYLRDMLLPMLFVEAPLALALMTASFFLTRFSRRLNAIPSPDEVLWEFSPRFRMVRNASYGLILILALILVYQRLGTAQSDASRLELTRVVKFIEGADTQENVVEAASESIYNLRVIFTDKESGERIENISVNLRGRSDKEKDFDISATTDSAGTLEFLLDKGSFRIGFNSTGFPADYVMPSPIFVDLKGAGTKILTVKLDKKALSRADEAYILITVYDENNQPVKGARIACEPMPGMTTSSLPQSVESIRKKSFTNAEGEAIFLLHPGFYTAGVAVNDPMGIHSEKPAFQFRVNSTEIIRYYYKLEKDGGSIRPGSAPAEPVPSPSPAASPLPSPTPAQTKK